MNSVLDEGKQLFPRMLVAVTTLEAGGKLEKLFDREHIPIWHQCRGMGTAPSEIMDIFGLSGTTRLITITFLPKREVEKLLEAMAKHLAFRQRGGGIAISIPVTGLQNHMLKLLKEEVRHEVEKRVEERVNEDMAETEKKSDYAIIWASVSSGYSDDVIDAAQAAGARGGTVIKGRRRNSERVKQHLGLATQEEQDFVMIVAAKEKKRDIMSAISTACGAGTAAHGVVLSLPVDEAIGLA